MPARYIIAVSGVRPTDAVRLWATDHAVAARAFLLFVHVDDEDSATPHAPAAAAAADPSFADDDTLILHGPVPHTLADFVRDDDVLVLGTDKSGFIHARVFGSRGIQIAGAVPCSVAVVPNVDLRFRSGVVAGVDRGETIAVIARAASDEATARADPLHLIHSTRGTRAPPALRTTESVLLRASLAATHRWPSLVVSARTTSRPAAQALLDASRNAALLVLGPGGRPPTYPFGSVMHDVLININAPVLIARR
ncbi:universal stress protein [Microbacterium sp. VKM Ac-2870]|uniref:universal stress protein n=1 Tax=Microbacterium sp. VKM Ac-2870 TaxID=2783825 RepID=UPI00188C6C73|nr:universal stress protein [Microbacterium sp. VKM Ac-2870]MBF4562630.1 universal stress protein [Microbacterium sp. VKM Ac-2870]